MELEKLINKVALTIKEKGKLGKIIDIKQEEVNNAIDFIQKYLIENKTMEEYLENLVEMGPTLFYMAEAYYEQLEEEYFE